jgi:hypothetical protein
MIFHQCAPRSVEWHKLRLAIPTSSEFHKILTPGGKPSKQAEGYLHELLAEWIIGHPIDSIETQWMARGIETEDEAVRAYEFQSDRETEPGGFFTTDDGMIGASPDRIVDVNGLLELKCCKPTTHVGYLLNASVEDDYKPQLQGQLFVTERQWVDIVAYHPELPAVVMRVERDEDYIALLAAALKTFVEVMLRQREDLEKRFGPFERKQGDPVKDHTWDFVTDEDVSAIFAATRAGVVNTTAAR